MPADEWIARAETSGTRARVRRWARVETVGVLVANVGVAGLVLALLASLAGIVCDTVTRRDQAGVLWWLWGVPLGLLVVGLILSGIGNAKRLAASYADAHVTVGRIDEVITHPVSGDDFPTYDLVVSAELPDSVLIRRRLEWTHSAFGLVGRPIRFRHRTLDPDDLRDAHFDGWSDES